MGLPGISRVTGQLCDREVVGTDSDGDTFPVDSGVVNILNKLVCKFNKLEIVIFNV